MAGTEQTVLEAAEAVCAGLYMTDFEHLGDTDGGRITWFTRGTKPKWVRVRVERGIDNATVFTTVEFLNMEVRPARPGRVILQVDCTGTRDEIQLATEATLERVLTLFRDVLTGAGVAGRDALSPGR